MGGTLSSFSEKQFVLLGYAADLLHLACGNRCQDRVDASCMNRTDADAAHTADACFMICFGGICRWNRLNGTLLSAQPTARTVLLGGGLDGNPGILPEWIIAGNGQVIRDSPLLQTPADLFGKSRQFRQIIGIGTARGKLAHDGMFRHGSHGHGRGARFRQVFSSNSVSS